MVINTTQLESLYTSLMSSAKETTYFSLLQAGFTRIGYNDRKKFLHVDVDSEKPQNIIFDY